MWSYVNLCVTLQFDFKPVANQLDFIVTVVDADISDSKTVIPARDPVVSPLGNATASPLPPPQTDVAAATDEHHDLLK
jgi:hypothetical protein